MPRIVKLVNVSVDNNNKVYEMHEQADGSWIAKWGRVGYSFQEQTYAQIEWDKKYKEKIKKGYKDITDLVSVEKETDEPELTVQGVSKIVQDLINFLQNCARGVIKQNYTVRVADVTQKQVDSAQEILNTLCSSKKKSREEINEILLSLYRTIPRKMKNTKLFLLQDTDEISKRLDDIIATEQDLLDTMAGQVSTTAVQGSSNSVDLNSFGLTIVPATKEQVAEIAAKTDLDMNCVSNIYAVSNSKTQKAFDAQKSDRFNTKTRLFYHGSRVANWWNILNTGLLIRPAGAVVTGGMFGSKGIYFADKARKSLGYTDGGYWAGGTAKKRFLGIYEVATGNEWDLFEKGRIRHSSWMYDLDYTQVRNKKCDSAFAENGADLRNSEWIVYHPSQSTIKYLVEFNN